MLKTSEETYYHVKELDLNTGLYAEIYELNFIPSSYSMNAVALHEHSDGVTFTPYVAVQQVASRSEHAIVEMSSEVKRRDGNHGALRSVAMCDYRSQMYFCKIVGQRLVVILKNHSLTTRSNCKHTRIAMQSQKNRQLPYCVHDFCARTVAMAFCANLIAVTHPPSLYYIQVI